MTATVELFEDGSALPAVRGFLHRPDGVIGDGLVLTHGAGSNCNAPLLVALAERFARDGCAVLRCDLPYRQKRLSGPPRPGEAAEDRAGLRRAVEALRKLVPKRIFLGGQSYGGRQATMLVAEEALSVDGLLLLSYPLHPPGKPAQLRTGHFPNLRTPALFVSGSADAFGSIEEMQAALKLIPARTSLTVIEGAGHDLLGRRKQGREELAERIFAAFDEFFR
jgi:hypothetical protein